MKINRALLVILVSALMSSSCAAMMGLLGGLAGATSLTDGYDLTSSSSVPIKLVPSSVQSNTQADGGKLYGFYGN